MDNLLSLESVGSHYIVKNLRHLFDSVEAQVRGLRGLGIPSEWLLSSIELNKLPTEIHLIVSRELTEGEWDLNTLLSIFDKELNARERAAATLNTQKNILSIPQNRLPHHCRS